MILNFQSNAARNAHIYDRHVSKDWLMLFAATNAETMLLDHIISDFFIDIETDPDVEKFADGSALFVLKSAISHDQLADWMKVTFPSLALLADQIQKSRFHLHMLCYAQNAGYGAAGIQVISGILNDEFNRRTGNNTKFIVNVQGNL